MRPVIFVKYYDKASTILAADQVSQALSERGVDSQAIYPENLGEYHDCIVVFIKTSRMLHVIQARIQRCRTVLDVHDTVIFKSRLKNQWLFDGLILRNTRAYEDYNRSGKNDAEILLHWDPRFSINYERVRDGGAVFVREAVHLFCDRNG